MKRRYWTKEELNFVKENFHRLGDEKMAEILSEVTGRFISSTMVGCQRQIIQKNIKDALKEKHQEEDI